MSELRHPRFPLLEIDKAYERFYEETRKAPDRILVDMRAMAGIRASLLQMPYLTASDMGGYRGTQLNYRNVPIMVGLPVFRGGYQMALYCDDSIEPMLVEVEPVID